MMCNNLSKEKRKRYDRLGLYAALYLQGKTIDEIARKVGRKPEEIENDLRGIKPINPTLYYQLFGDEKS